MFVCLFIIQLTVENGKRKRKCQKSKDWKRAPVPGLETTGHNILKCMLCNKTNISVTSYNSIKLLVLSCISTSYLISSYIQISKCHITHLFECVFLIPLFFIHMMLNVVVSNCDYLFLHCCAFLTTVGHTLTHNPLSSEA